MLSDLPLLLAIFDLVGVGDGDELEHGAERRMRLIPNAAVTFCCFEAAVVAVQDAPRILRSEAARHFTPV